MKPGFDFIGLAGFIALHLLCLVTFIMPSITYCSASIIPRWVIDLSAFISSSFVYQSDFIGLAGFTFIMPSITYCSASIIPRWVNRSTDSGCLYFTTFITLHCWVLGLVSFIIHNSIYPHAFITFIPKPYNPSTKSEFLNYAAIKPMIFRTASDFLLKLGLTETNIENICKKSFLGKINAKQNSRNTQAQKAFYHKTMERIAMFQNYTTKHSLLSILKPNHLSNYKNTYPY